MKIVGVAAAALAVALSAAVPAQAQRQISDHVRCDGNPDNVSAGETAARLLGAVTLLGLFAPPPEQSDEAERLFGAEGVAVCETVLGVESNEVRRAQLILARAIHHIEAGQYDQAIAEARRLETDRPAFAATGAFRLSFRLAAMDIEAMALVGAGRIEEGRAKAFEMAAAAPYDAVTQARALRYVQLAPVFGEAERRFYDNGVRLLPILLLERIAARQLAHDFRGAAEDFDLWMSLWATMSDEPQIGLLAEAALVRALAGDAERAEEFARRAREELQGNPRATATAAASELLDLYQIWRTARDGRVADARLLFASRTNWLAPSAAAVGEVARMLGAGAQPAELIGTLNGDPERFRAELLERRRTEFVDQKTRFRAVRFFSPQASYDRFAANVWRSGRSRYFAREDNTQMNGRFVNVARDGFGTPAGYALLLHAALTAQAEGKSRFMIVQVQPTVITSLIRFGNPGDEGMIEPLSFDTAQVIADLSPLIARPVRR